MSCTERCRWCNMKNPVYVEYHDREWGVLRLDDAYLFEMLILESFQAGLSWECVLNKREAFREAFDGFCAESVASFDCERMTSLAQNKEIIRNKLKIKAAVNNAAIFLEIAKEYGSFCAYLGEFWNGETIIESDRTTSPLSDAISADLYRRGMRFVGSTIIYSYLQAIGVINSHESSCFLNKKTVL